MQSLRLSTAGIDAVVAGVPTLSFGIAIAWATLQVSDSHRILLLRIDPIGRPRSPISSGTLMKLSAGSHG